VPLTFIDTVDEFDTSDDLGQLIFTLEVALRFFGDLVQPVRQLECRAVYRNRGTGFPRWLGCDSPSVEVGHG